MGNPRKNTEIWKNGKWKTGNSTIGKLKSVTGKQKLEKSKLLKIGNPKKGKIYKKTAVNKT